MKRLLLHIGTGKTGTSSIQNFLYENRKTLRKHFSVDYLDCGLTHNLHFGEPIHAHYAIVEWVTKHDTRSLDQLIRQIESSSCHTVILSCENFYHHFDDSHIAFWHSLLAQFKTELLVYVRRQDLFMESAWKQQAKVGALRMPFPLFLERHTKPEHLDAVHGNYHRMLKRWADMFRADAIRVRVFSSSSFANGDLIDDFLQASGIDVSQKGIQLKRLAQTNVSLSSEFSEFIRRVNVTKLIAKKDQQRFLKSIGETLDFKNPPLLSTADRIAVLKNYEKSNQLLFSEFGDGEVPDCFSVNSITERHARRAVFSKRMEDLTLQGLILLWKSTQPRWPAFIPLRRLRTLLSRFF